MHATSPCASAVCAPAVLSTSRPAWHYAPAALLARLLTNANARLSAMTAVNTQSGTAQTNAALDDSGAPDWLHLNALRNQETERYEQLRSRTGLPHF